MTIAYLGNWNPYSYSTEKLIKKAFEELGHKVIPIDEREIKMDKIPKADLFLFHKGTRFGFPLKGMVALLNQITCKKAFWYFDPVWGDREEWMARIIPFVDIGFMTNETFIKRHRFENLKVLRQGCDKQELGKKQEKYECDIAFTGSIYGSRQKFVDGLQNTYGSRFRIFTNVFGRDFYNLCASVKILVSPKFPANDFFWSNRIYMTLGAGGFLIHPKCEGLKEEYTAGIHYEDYGYGEELKAKIDYYLENEKDREKIKKAGHEHTLENYTYKHRCKSLINEVKKL